MMRSAIPTDSNPERNALTSSSITATTLAILSLASGCATKNDAVPPHGAHHARAARPRDGALGETALASAHVALSPLPAPEARDADNAVSSALQAHPGSTQAAIESADRVSALARNAALVGRTKEKCFALLTTTAGEPFSDQLLLRTLQNLDGWKELFMLAKYHGDDRVAREAITLLSPRNDTVREWLAAERAQFQHLSTDRRAGERSAGLLRSAVQSSIEKSVELRAELSRFQEILRDQGVVISKFEQERKEQEAKIQELRASQTKLAEQLKSAEENVAKLRAESKERLEIELKKWNAEHITVAGNTYHVVRVAASGATVGEQHNFRLDVKKDETVLFVLSGYGPNDCPSSAYRLKQDRKNDSDPTHVDPMKHGTTWIAKSSYADWNERAYVHRNDSGSPITKADFYIVNEARPKPSEQFAVPNALRNQIAEIGRTMANNNSALDALLPKN